MTLPLSRTEIDYPLIHEAHAASSLADAQNAWRAARVKAPAMRSLPAVRADVALELERAAAGGHSRADRA